MKPRAKCLLVDDIEENLFALSALLADVDVEPLTAHSGVEALEKLLVEDVAVALLDVQMPEMNGYQLAELMRGTERTRGIPIIFLTAGASDETRTFKGYEAGAVDVLYKPIDPYILRSKVRTFLELYQQRQQLAEDLRERTEKLRLNETFIAALGHDLRNPLTAILMSAGALERRSDPESVRRLAATILSSGQRMARMIEDVLDFARLRVGQGIRVRSGQGDLHRLLEAVIDETRAAHPTREVQVSVQGDTQGTWDSVRMSQVASNLISNALQHGQPDTPVVVTIDGTDAHTVVFEISNLGEIPAARLPHIFDPFFTGNRSAPRGENLGLGLFIVQQVVRAHSGDVRVNCDGGRTSFRIHLPRKGPGSEPS